MVLKFSVLVGGLLYILRIFMFGTSELIDLKCSRQKKHSSTSESPLTLLLGGSAMSM
jgi:hypothetical protein